MKESKIEQKIREYAESKGCEYRKFVSPGKVKVQDRLIISPFGITGFLEIKKPGGDIHDKQIRYGLKLQTMKVPVGIVDNVEDGIKFVNYLLRISTVNFNTPETWYHDAILNS